MVNHLSRTVDPGEGNNYRTSPYHVIKKEQRGSPTGCAIEIHGISPLSSIDSAGAAYLLATAKRTPRSVFKDEGFLYHQPPIRGRGEL